jgi:hypothetical protein
MRATEVEGAMLGVQLSKLAPMLRRLRKRRQMFELISGQERKVPHIAAPRPRERRQPRRHLRSARGRDRILQASGRYSPLRQLQAHLYELGRDPVQADLPSEAQPVGLGRASDRVRHRHVCQNARYPAADLSHRAWPAVSNDTSCVIWHRVWRVNDLSVIPRPTSGWAAILIRSRVP